MNRALRATGLAILALSIAACGGGLDEGWDEYSGPTFAPDDLAATLPREISGAEVRVRTLSPGDLQRLLALGGGKGLEHLARRLSDEPTSVIGATATITLQDDVSSIIALRSKGVPGEESYWEMLELAGRRTGSLDGGVRIGGKSVLVPYAGATDLILRDVGEVIYLIHAADAVTAEAIVTALP